MAVHKKVHSTKLQMQKQQTVCTEVCTCGTEDESCNTLMLDDETIDEDSLTDDM